MDAYDVGRIIRRAAFWVLLLLFLALFVFVILGVRLEINFTGQDQPQPTPVTEVHSDENSESNSSEGTRQQPAMDSGEWPEDLFLSPVPAKECINEESSWLICEDGVLLDATATFDRGSSEAVHYIQCPEGGFAFVSAGQGTLDIDGFMLELPPAEGRNHVVPVRCRIDDGLQDTDLNFTIKFSGYVPGNVITSPMPTGAYISADWFRQQLMMSAGLAEGQSGGNCGASGCSETWVHPVDANTDFHQLFVVQKDNIDAWEQRTIQ